LIGQAAASFDNRYFLTGGLRLERNAGASTVTTVSTLPMVGAAVVHDFPLFTTKLRASYGRGIRPPHTATRQTTWLGVNRVALQTSLGPEEQSGIEGGADLLFGRTLALHATLFDQRAFGLIQPVALVSQQQSNSGPGGPRRLEYVLQNVGEISNRGWELQSSYDIGRLSLNGALSAVNSRVVRLASGYSGDLRPGDRMLAVPARTMGLSSTWTSARYRLTLGVSRAADWINYDRLALADAVADPQQNPRALVGQQQRAYWLHYPGVTRLNASFSTNLTRELMLIVGGENLLNEQRGEPDNVTVVPGRTITAKLRAHF
jgi:iron complex outermembrane receptor protein